MTKQTKQAQLQEYKAIDDGPGGFQAYATIFGELDDTGDIILSGAYKNTIPQFLKRGFIARSHDWSTAIGLPVGAKEDSTGFWVDARYHSTQEAQQQRTITNERQSAGLSSFVSIGYEAASSPIFVMPQDYATEIPKYSAPGMAEQNLAKASSFPEVRVLPEIHLYEISLVQVPALSSAVVTGAKSAANKEDDDLVDGRSYSADLQALVDDARRVADRTEKRSALRTKEGRVLSSANWQALADMVDQMDELSKRVRAMLDEAKPKPKEEDQPPKSLDIQAVLNHLLVMDLQLKGVPIK